MDTNEISTLIIASLCVNLRVQKILCHSTPHHKITNDNSPQITPRLSKSRSVEDIHCMSAVQSRGNCDFFKTPKTQMTQNRKFYNIVGQWTQSLQKFTPL